MADDFTFPATITIPPPCLLESPRLWPSACSRYEEVEDEWNYFNFCYVDHDEHEEEEKMDLLWEDLNERFSRNRGKKIADQESDNSSGERDDHVQVCCVKTLKLFKANGGRISWRKASVLVLIRFLFKKSLAMHNSRNSVKKIGW